MTKFKWETEFKQTEIGDINLKESLCTKKIMLPTCLKEDLDLIKKLDRGRWMHEKSSREFYEPETNFSSDEKILCHWITYVTNRIIPADQVWKNLHKIFSYWVKEYKKTIDPEKFLEENFDKDNGFRGYDEICGKSRYPEVDFKNIRKTLLVLENYDKSLVKFVSELLTRFKDDKKVVRKIACALYLITYDNKLDEDKTLYLLNSKKEFERYYKRWEKKVCQNKKRLWAAFRDYIKNPYYQKNFIETLHQIEVDNELVELWRKFGEEFDYLNQLELPGDRWNERFAREYLIPLAIYLGIKNVHSKNVSELARSISEHLYNRYKIEFYPELFDFSFNDKFRTEFFKKRKTKFEIKILCLSP